MSKSDTVDILADISRQWRISLPKSKNLRVYDINGARLIAGTGFRALKIGDHMLPFLTEIEILKKFPLVIVDMGAVKFMCNGADVMRPGITSYSEFSKGDIVCVAEESQHKFLAVGISSRPSADLNGQEKGPVIRNMHYVSDKFWNAAKEIKN